MHSVDDTLQLILSHCEPLPAVAVEINQAAHRVLRRAAQADLDFPPFDRSAMDGYAVHSSPDAKDMGFTIVGSVPAGDVADFKLQLGEAARVTTGAILPLGATHVWPQEETELRGGKVHLLRPQPSTHIRQRGEDARKGDTLIPAGQFLRPAHLSILSSIGITYPLVGRKPRIMHIVSGNELIHPSGFPREGQVRDSNSTLIATLCAEIGASVRNHIHAPDDEEKILELANSFPAITYDILIFSGGSGAGAFDFARSVIEKLGFTIHLQGVNVRPGKPLLFGTRGNQLAFGLPGNPLSHFVTFQLFVRPALLALLGAVKENPWMEGRLANDLPEPPNSRLTYWPARWFIEHGHVSIEALPWRSSGHLASLTTANALLKIEPGTPPLTRGANVTFLTI